MRPEVPELFFVLVRRLVPILLQSFSTSPFFCGNRAITCFLIIENNELSICFR